MQFILDEEKLQFLT